MIGAAAFNRRLLLLAAIILLALIIVVSDSLHAHSEQLLGQAEAIIKRFPLWGMLVFVLFAMVSAMLAFFSSAIIVPIGVYTWGATTCFLLLWLGWILGGLLAFTLGRVFGQPLAAYLVGGPRLAKLQGRFNSQTRFRHLVIFQAALPSEIPGYVLGAARCSLRAYLAALALVELPYALGTVYLGSSFLERQPERLLVVGSIALLVAAVMYYLHHMAKGRAR
ncbi:MAG: TVP38/TMEM64 family protein [Pseudomonadales bacterium]|nr:TVP38/TMEM64 family protein [Pseudomonadales bacterium]